MRKLLYIFAMLFAANAFGVPTMSPEAAKAYEERMLALYEKANETVAHKLQCSMYLRITATNPETRMERFNRGFNIEREARVELTEMGFQAEEADMYIYQMFLGTQQFLHRMNEENACP